MGRTSLAVGVLIMLVIVLAVGLYIRSTITTTNTTTTTIQGMYSQAAVAADSGTCSEISRDILKRGGSAVDGAIAALLCVGVVNPHSMGIGGGLFLTIFNAKTGNVEVINARETAPSNTTENMFGNSTDLAQRGGLAIAVPGEIRGYELAHQRHGKLPWRELFLPSIKLAREGFPVGRALAQAISDNSNDILLDKYLCSVFCNKNGTILKENNTITFPKLANTLQEIADKGPSVFYNGTIAENLLNDIRNAGGIITAGDLLNYTAILDKNPLRVLMGDFTMFVPNAPASGPVLTLILNILRGYNFTADSVSSDDKKILTYHRIVEAFKFAYAKRSFLGDPQFLNISDFIQKITSQSFADDIRKNITDNTTQQESYYGPEFYIPDDHGISHLSVVDEEGNAVSATSTINRNFGSKVLSNSTGILLNNEMDDFSSPLFTSSFGVPPSPNNFIRPQKRPLSSMCPAIILDKNNKVKMVVGGAGGPIITTAVAQVILNALFFNYDMKKAVVEPRIHNQLRPNTTLTEPDFNKVVLNGLMKKNHIMKLMDSNSSVVQAILRQGQSLYAVSDPRKGGYAAGY